MAPRKQTERAAEELILEHLPDIATLCNRMFAQQSDAQDAIQESVVAILRALPSYRGEGPVRHWLLKVALNAARNHRRKSTRKTRRETDLRHEEAEHAMPSTPHQDREDRELLRTAIASIPEQLREPVVLHYYHGLTQVEIGGLLACSQKTVHQRIKKGLALLTRQLGSSPAMGLLPVALGPGLIALDAVSMELVATVKQSVAGYYSATTTATAVASQLAVGETLAAAGVNTGSVVMQSKLIAAAAVIAVTCFLGGAVLSDRLLGSEGKDTDAAALQTQAETNSAALESLQAELAGTRARSSGKLAQLNTELGLLREQLDGKDAAIVRLDDRVRTLTAAAEPATADSTLSRDERWAKIQEALAAVMGILEEMQTEGANQFELGPRMVAELGKLSVEQFDEIAAFDAKETDPAITGVIRAVMLQAFIFVPGTDHLRDAYMDRYLQRVTSGSYGEAFSHGALSRISFSMPPFVDAYAKIVEPLKDDAKTKFLDLALSRVEVGKAESLRRDGARFLARAPGARATEELMRLAGQVANSKQLRLIALKGLSTRANEDVLRFLRDTQKIETDEAIREQVGRAVTLVEQKVAGKR